MKKTIIILLAFIMLLSSAACAEKNVGNSENNKDTETISTELIDEKEPVTDADSGSYGFTADDGVTYEGSYRLPKIIHKTLTGAEEVNKSIKDYFDENYGKYFEDGKGEKMFLTVDYSYKYERDVLAILLTAEKKANAGDEPVYVYKAFFYDALVDIAEKLPVAQ